jgi:5-methylcytosine-specific restriction endonuclease McrA
MDEKRCSRCKETKTLVDFNKDNSTKDGLSRYCKVCIKAFNRATYLEDPAKAKRRSVEWTKRNKEKVVAARKERYWKDPERFRAEARATDPEKARARAKAYRLANPERHAAAIKSWRDENKDKVKAYKAKVLAENPEKVLGWSRAWAARNKERCKKNNEAWRAKNYEMTTANARRWKAENKEKNRTITKAWFAANPERARLFGHERRAREKGARGTATLEQLQARIDYYGGLCYLCGKPHEAIDHVIPLAKGGTGWPANLRPICTSCNSRKKDRMPEIRRSKAAGLPTPVKL